MLPSTRETADFVSAQSYQGAGKPFEHRRVFRHAVSDRTAKKRTQHWLCRASVPATEEPQRKKVSLVNLGCPKNTVDVSLICLRLKYLILVQFLLRFHSISCPEIQYTVHRLTLPSDFLG